MNGTERIKALLEGTPIDRTPIGGWYHMPLVDRNISDYTNEMINSTEFNHWDFIKIMTNGNYYTYAYGGKIKPSSELRRWYGSISKYPICSAEDAAKLPVLDIDNEIFAYELEAFRILKNHFNGTVPLIATIFNPLTAVQECMGMLNSKPIIQMMQDAPEALHKALEAMTQTNMNYMNGLYKEGVDGIFLANQYAMRSILTDVQYDEFVEPYEKRLVEHFKDHTWFNMAHIHGDADLRMERYYKYPDDEIQALNWENCPGGIPKEKISTIEEVRKHTNKIIIAGIDQNHDFVTPENDREAVKKRIVERYQTAKKEVGSNRFIFAPGCAMETGGTYLNRLLYEVVEEYGLSD